MIALHDILGKDYRVTSEKKYNNGLYSSCLYYIVFVSGEKLG